MLEPAETVASFNDAIKFIKNNKNEPKIVLKIEENSNTIFKNRQSLEKLKLNDHQIVAIHSSLDSKFCIIWKFKEEIFILYIFDDIGKENLEKLCNFLVEFLVKCLNKEQSGKK